MEQDGIKTDELRVDGGMIANNWLLQFLADMLNATIDRPSIIETTALGAAYLAGLQAGIYSSLDDIANHRVCDRRVHPTMNDNHRDTLYRGWLDAVNRTRSTR
jgi:glycerol kinase